MKKASYIIFDCETGGLDENENPITQIAFLTIDNDTLKETNRFEMFIQPYDDLVITKKALKMTGLKMSDINSGETKSNAVKLIKKIFKDSMPSKHPSNRPVLVGHNVKFDMRMLSKLFELSKDNLFDYINDNPICTMTLSKMLTPKTDSLALGICCENAGIKLQNAHRAMPDVVATTDLFRVYVRTLRGNELSASNQESNNKKSRNKFQF